MLYPLPSKAWGNFEQSCCYDRSLIPCRRLEPTDQGHCYFIKFPALLSIRSLKRTAMDKALNKPAAIIGALSLAVGLSRRIKRPI